MDSQRRKHGSEEYASGRRDTIHKHAISTPLVVSHHRDRRDGARKARIAVELLFEDGAWRAGSVKHVSQPWSRRLLVSGQSIEDPSKPVCLNSAEKEWVPLSSERRLQGCHSENFLLPPMMTGQLVW